jgi:hypothetical protein
LSFPPWSSYPACPAAAFFVAPPISASEHTALCVCDPVPAYFGAHELDAPIDASSQVQTPDQWFIAKLAKKKQISFHNSLKS